MADRPSLDPCTDQCDRYGPEAPAQPDLIASSARPGLQCGPSQPLGLLAVATLKRPMRDA